MPAVWRLGPKRGESVFTCTACAWVYGLDEHTRQQAAPHANALAGYLELVAEQKDKVKFLYQVLPLAEELLLALPPCPVPLSVSKGCQRCVWMFGYAARRSLWELTVAVARLKPDPFDDWPKGVGDAANLLCGHKELA